MSQPLLFTPPTSSFDPTFWEELYERKLNVYRLTADEVALRSNHSDNGSLKFTKSSFDNVAGIQGGLLNKNKIEEFSNADKVALIKSYALRILDTIVSGKAIRDTSLLSQFLLLTFADLKAYRFVFWCAQPALALNEALHGSVVSTCDTFDPLSLRAAYQHMFTSFSPSSIFAIRVVDGVRATLTLYDAWAYRHDENVTFVCLDTAGATGAIGWNIRNFITLLACYSNSPADAYSLSDETVDWDMKGVTSTVKILALRGPLLPRLISNHAETVATRRIDTFCDRDCSILATITLPSCPLLRGFDSDGTTGLTVDSLSPFKIVGWEQNDRGKSGPRVADMRNTLDPTLLMQQAVDLNLRLMKWRMWPTLAVDQLSQQRCLLLGSGTLGCSVARALMGWGVRHIAFVDNGTVSYSNPVRQSLFEFADCQARRFKAEAAADSIMRIFPGMIAKGVVMSIPMPGHPYNPSASTTAEGTTALTDDAARVVLEQLITDHDIIFNLTDSREARWLPTLLCQAIGRQCINAALGFDSYLVMRHGYGTQDLGCYFCNDIVAAANSQRDRTLDEQCTVTRPGLSFMAGALCAEVMVAVIQQQVEVEAAASKREKGESEEVLSAQYSVEVVPHQIRGSLQGFSQMVLEAPAFPMCTACSNPIVTAYQANPAVFVEQVCADPGVLEIVSGVRAMVEEVDVNLCIDSDEEF